MFGLFGSSNSSANQEWEYVDLPSPQTTEEYEELASNTLDKRLRQINSSGWSNLKTAESNDGVSIETKPVEGSDIVMVRVRGTVNLRPGQTIDDILMTLHEPTLSQKKELYHSVVDYEILNRIDDRTHISRTVAQTTGISDREFINIRTYILQPDGSYLLGVQAINYKSFPFDAYAVRGTSNSGILIEEINESTAQITSVDHIDPKGWVPVFVVDSFLGSAGDWIKRLSSL